MSCSLIHTPVIIPLHILLLLAVCPPPHLPLLPPPEINSWLAPKRGSLPRLLKDLSGRADETAELKVSSQLPGKSRAEGVWLWKRRHYDEANMLRRRGGGGGKGSKRADAGGARPPVEAFTSFTWSRHCKHELLSVHFQASRHRGLSRTMLTHQG